MRLGWTSLGMHRTSPVCSCGWAGHRWECTGHASSVDAVRAISYRFFYIDFVIDMFMRVPWTTILTWSKRGLLHGHPKMTKFRSTISEYTVITRNVLKTVWIETQLGFRVFVETVCKMGFGRGFRVQNFIWLWVYENLEFLFRNGYLKTRLAVTRLN